jgi:DHA1 family tetracycline resistance protein-like MFS transporter
MPDQPSNPPSPPSSPNPLMTEPELVELDKALVPHPPKGRRAAATFIFFTVTLDMLALGMIAPVLPRLIQNFLHGDTSNAARYIGLFGTLFAVMQFFFSPIVGSLSDRFGRRPLVLLSNFGLGLDYLVMAWAPTLNWLFLGRIISGLTSSSIPRPWPIWPTSPRVSAAPQRSAC